MRRPVDDQRHRRVIDAGDTASGLISVDRNSGAIIENNSGFTPDGTIIRRLMGTCRSIEKRLGMPQDIEWAEAGGTLYYLQSRPITTIENRSGITIHWTRELTEERYPVPISPLGWSILQSVLLENMKTLSRRFGLDAKHPEEVAKTIRHYVYSNKQFFTIPGSLRPNPLKQLILIPRLLVQLPVILFLAIPALVNRSGFGLKWLALSRFFKAFIFPHARDIHATWGRHLAATLGEIDACNDPDFTAMDLRGLLNEREKMDVLGCRYMEPDLAIYVVKIACSWIIERMGRVFRGDAFISFLVDLTSGIEENRTLHMNVEMEQMSDYLNERPDIKKLLLDEKYEEAVAAIHEGNKPLHDSFIEENGHLTTNWDIMESTWGEDPRKIMQMLRSYIISGAHHSFRGHRDEQKQRYTSAKTEALEKLRRAPWMIAFFGDVQGFLREFMSIDEEHHFYCSRLFKPMRRLFIEIGTRLADLHIIDQVDDIFFMTLPEITHRGEAHHFSRRYLTQARRSSYNRSRGVRPPDDYINQTPVLPESVSSDGQPPTPGRG